jgi:hypothetical protein
VSTGEKRPTNSERRLTRLEEEDPPREDGHGILELFDEPEEAPDEDAPLLRDPQQ